MISLRPYQERAIERVVSLFSSGVRRVLLVLPTGGGKTVIASEIIRRALVDHQRRAIFLAHRRELIKNTYCKVVRNGFDPGSVGVIMAGADWRVDRELYAPDVSSLNEAQLWDRWAKRRPQAETQVGSIDTFRNRAKPHAGLIIVDEAHRAIAKSYRDVQCDALYETSWHLGLTATPMRGDGKPLRDAYDEIVIGATYAELVSEGFLVSPTVYGTTARADMSGVRKSKGDYNQDDLARAVDKVSLIGDIIEKWKQRGNDAPTFCFCVNVEHSKHVAARFVEAGVSAVHVDGNTETTERDDAIAALVDGRIKVLCNCNVFSEGTDVPCVKTIILARPTTSEALALQQAGRGSRPFGATPFVILDHAQSFSPEGGFMLPQMHRDYDLDGRKKTDREGRPPTRECPGCGAYVPISMSECLCGFVFPSDEEEDGLPKEEPGELVELTPNQFKRAEEWNCLVRDWRWENEIRDARGDKLIEGSWCKREWRRKHHRWPPKGSRIPSLTPAQCEANKMRKAQGRDA